VGGGEGEEGMRAGYVGREEERGRLRG